ncbi:LAO/AO transport system ATPase [Myxococcus xanthus DK 1622]|uniref:LAO/AO transport system ATPase n=1 Tax=Myxococcus xanthus (strain DK1622) TaxID=246197 RepID=Q1DA40_MYXXD|nr:MULTISPECIES: methylmalonyl Co-A mutase-associated GTPase MeaB [Myxococcus]ABF90363.1 LAO/AO transport system ATPase [Myxococcus xanthus DK 1622]NOJ54639.1 methylmalonyl Co-A mutase-associated GTPase MeaB [Myxococcus xanthus]QPM81792.1 methylmalonyl Co-A mutase-associated GTPase MeaB [Myxococcus xanthus]QVW71042.1 methylmalonyl Co-A mutase-associated GTPase MeaB [Myxococcus xanthus DZ2]QZZ49991.1 putative GTPase [Myxococcus xanthus]
MKLLSADAYVDGVRAGDRAMLARTITLVESELPRHAALAQEVLTRLLPATGGSRRVGISGVPGAGKSTFIDALGMHLVKAGKRVAVLAIDPSSTVSGGSILGDKTRMARLSREEAAYIRPSPSSGTLGGVARKTRETLLLCEAAGFDVVLVETVGVGQSETVVADLVDFYLVLMLAGAGDELQGIKRGILEVADMLAINKADGDNKPRAERARSELRAALHLMRPGAEPEITTCSALEGTGIEKLWTSVETQLGRSAVSGAMERRRKAQQVQWMWSMVQDGLRAALRAHPEVSALVPTLEADVREGRATPTSAALRVLGAFLPETRA